MDPPSTNKSSKLIKYVFSYLYGARANSNIQIYRKSTSKGTKTSKKWSSCKNSLHLFELDTEAALARFLVLFLKLSNFSDHKCCSDGLEQIRPQDIKQVISKLYAIRSILLFRYKLIRYEDDDAVANLKIGPNHFLEVTLPWVSVMFCVIMFVLLCARWVLGFVS